MDNSTIKSDEIMESSDEEIKQFQQILLKRKQPVECKIYIFYLRFIALLVAVSIYCYLIKHRSKQKHLLGEVLY